MNAFQKNAGLVDDDPFLNLRTSEEKPKNLR